MKQYWYEEDNGLLFKNMPSDSCEKDRLEMLYFEGIAEERGEDYFVSYENIVLLSDGDAELLNLPDKNPYQISMVADGTIGFNDLHYIIKVLKPNGQPFVNSIINGCILHINDEDVYRLNENQYRMNCLLLESNKTVPNLDKRELPGYSLTNLARIQRHAKKTDAKLDPVLSEDNQKIVLPEKIDVTFVDNGDGNVHINPVLLEEETGNAINDKYNKDFQEQFAKGFSVRNVYKTEDEGKTIKIVCPPEIKDGLVQVKNINKTHISSTDAQRFEAQPRELFKGDVFKFRRKENEDSQSELSDDINDIESEWEDIPEEGELYSDRIRGLAKIRRSKYFGSGHKMDWLPQEGTDFDTKKEENRLNDNLQDEKTELSSDLLEDNDCGKNKDWQHDINNDDCSSLVKQDNKDEKQATENNKLSVEKKENMAFDIRPNFDIADYMRDMTARTGMLGSGALQDGISLYDYQEEAVQWMYSAWSKGYTGVLLADDMGLGKTLQALAFLANLKEGLADTSAKPVLIVGPTALLKNWKNEYEKFVRKGVFSGIISLHGNAIREYQVGEVTPNGKKKLELNIPNDVIALTTYETLRDYQFSFAEINWGIIVVDEAQKIKNPSTGVTIAIKAMNYDYAICLSGTPVENSWTDLWSIMDFVQPQWLGTLRAFRTRYIQPLKELNGDIKGIEELGYELKENLNPLFLRRMKNDKLRGLPKKDIHIRTQEMPEYQKKRYMSVIDAAKNSEVPALVTIAKLRDISLHPDIGIKQAVSFYKMEPDAVINQSARLIQTFEILKEVCDLNEKVLIFVVSKKMQQIVRHLIKKKFGIDVYPPVNGEMNGTSRQKIIDEFNRSQGFGVLILSPEAAGVGFTITSANHVIHLSRTWNPAKEDQATDRVYRIGQKRDVHVYLPLAVLNETGNSFDEKLNALLEYKRGLSDNVLFPTGDNARDGEKIFNDCVIGESASNTKDFYLMVEDVDTCTGIVFEQIVADLYAQEDGVEVKKTSDTNDNGADVVVINADGENGILIQCKHKDDPEEGSVGKKGIQEVFASVNYYSNLNEYKGIKFKTAVITNASEFSNGARELAHINNVELIARGGLKKMLAEKKLPNIY